MPLVGDYRCSPSVPGCEGYQSADTGVVVTAAGINDQHVPGFERSTGVMEQGGVEVGQPNGERRYPPRGLLP